MHKSASERVVESRRKNCDQIQFNVPKGERDKIKAYAESIGLSMNEYIRRSIRFTMEHGCFEDVSF